MYVQPSSSGFVILIRARDECVNRLHVVTEFFISCIAFFILAVMETKSVPGSNETQRALRRTKTVLGELETPNDSETRIRRR